MNAPSYSALHFCHCSSAEKLLKCSYDVNIDDCTEADKEVSKTLHLFTSTLRDIICDGPDGKCFAFFGNQTIQMIF